MNIMTKSSYFGWFMPFNIINKEDVRAVGYNKDTGVFMLKIELNDQQKRETNKQYERIYYKGVPASLAYSMSKGLDFDCFYACLFHCEYDILAYEYV